MNTTEMHECVLSLAEEVAHSRPLTKQEEAALKKIRSRVKSMRARLNRQREDRRRALKV